MNRYPRTLGLAMLVVLLLSNLLLGAQAGSQAAASPLAAATPELVPGSKLVFASERDNNWEIYSANDDGSAQTRLTTHNAPDIYPRFNRGCTSIAFASRRNANNYNLFTMNPDGSNVTQLTEAAGNNSMPAWSPDGTKIAFASDRDGNFDIFVMDAGGTGVTKLTFDPAQDISPTWSLDGSQIVFVSRRTGDYCVWKMNADGNGQTQLSSQPNSQDPAWSPDGTQIAYDADADGDGRKELWLMNADGTGQQLLYEPGTDTEARARSWSPDGRYIAFTYVHWVQRQGNWVWDVANLQAWDTYNPGTIVPLVTDSGKDWTPDWQTVDILAPTTSMNALPWLSAGPFTVSWGGYDNGPAGLCAYDVQYRDGPGGAWMDWQVQTTATSAPFPGVGGHTYYFQVRARDCAYNYESYPGGDGDTHTLVEAWPPQTAVDPLPDHYRGTQIQVTWSGYDPGSSGIATYDVQVNDGGGAWTTWYTQTTATAATFNGTSGHTYSFRCRATDNAHNVEAWPAGDGDTTVTFYTWAITGSARDNRETLLAGVNANTTPAAFQVLPSGLDGEYASYVADSAGTYDVNWLKTTYTSLPNTAFGGTADASFDVIIPPGDNVVENWGFESGSLAPAWLASGNTLPAITTTLHHTGEGAALLGCQQVDFAAPWNVSSLAGTSYNPTVVADSSGNVHVAWYQNGGGIPGEIYYARRTPAGVWQPPENVSSSPVLAGAPQIAMDGSGVVHLVWAEDTGNIPEIYYAQWTTGGGWSIPVNISLNAGESRDPQLAVQSDGTVHVIWRDRTGTGTLNVFYAQRTTSWSTPEQISSSTSDVNSPQLAVGSGGAVRAVWSEGEVYYARRDGSWSTPVAVSASSGTASAPRLAMAGTAVHVLWVQAPAGVNGIYYAYNGGSWSSPLEIYSSTGTLGDPQIAVDGAGAAHAVWRIGTGTSAEIYYALRSGGTWSTAVDVSNTAGESISPQLVVDSVNTAHVAWVDRTTGNYEIYYSDRDGGVWSMPKNGSRNSGRSDQPRLFAQDSMTVHLVWADATGGLDKVLYAQAAFTQQAGDSQIAQRITLAAGGNAPTLSLLYLLDGAAPNSGSSLLVQVVTGSGATTLFSTTASVNTWTHRWFDLSAWAGQTITLTANVQQAANRLCTWGYLDEVTIGSAYPDLWISKSGGAAGLPGSNVIYHIAYGNRGGAAAAAVTVTDLVPAELVYLAADPPPASTSPLTWNIGPVPALGGPYEIVLTATVQPGAAMWSTCTNTVSIATSTTEPETTNNSAQAATLIAARVYLPIVFKSW
jgi:uncharacterized repeat protein (TIGR01451 family)